MQLKRITLITIILLIGLFLTGCYGEEEVTSLDTIMNAIYQDVDIPNLEINTLSTNDLDTYLGYSNIPFSEGLISKNNGDELLHLVILLRVDKQQLESYKEELRLNITSPIVEFDSRNIIIDSKGDVILIMIVNSNRDILYNNFLKLK